MPALDIIGDLHGRATQLRQLLDKLGYTLSDGAYQHTSRKVVFIGDLIDYGAEQQTTLNIVRAMVSSGSAYVVMGNHEFNAVCFATEDPENPSVFLRPHSEKNLRQHRAFLAEFPLGSQEYREAIDWFKTLPLYLFLDGVGFIHACWSPFAINQLKPSLNQNASLPDSLFLKAGKKGTQEYELIEVLLKGPEMTLPPGYSFLDKHNVERDDIRVRWWAEGRCSYRELALVPEGQEGQVPTLAAPWEKSLFQVDHPVFIGHYWFRGEPSLQTDRVVCVDYSGDNGLAAYRWDGEVKLRADKFVKI